MEENNKGYYAIIPANVRYDNKLSPSAKLLYGEITALTNKKGLCWATNEYFSKLYDVSERTITDWIKLLKEKKYIDYIVQTKRYDDGTVKKIRFISINHIEENLLNHIEDFCTNHIEKNFAYNNTYINNTKYNNTINSSSIINIYSYIEENFGRTLSPIEYEEISNWEDNELTRYAIKQSILNGKCNVKYISRILDSYRFNNITSVQQAQQSEENFRLEIEKRKQTQKYNNKYQSMEDIDALFDKVDLSGIYNNE